MKNKIKILFLHTGAELYGADRILLSIVANLDRQIFEPVVVLPNDGPLVNELRRSGVRVKIVEYPILRRKYFNPIGLIQYIVKYSKSIKKLLEIVKSENVDLIHNNTIAVLEGITLKRKSDVKLVSHVHEMLENPSFIAAFLYKQHAKYADEIICVSDAVKRHIIRYVGKCKKIVVVHNGIKPVDASIQNAKERFGIPREAKVFTIIGRINAIKGQDDFIEAIEIARRKNKNIYGLIVGDAFSGQEWRVEELKRKLLDRGISDVIKYVGFVQDVSVVYAATDVLVLSSVKNDSFPTVVLEAMSCGIPTIAYKCGGVEEMINDGKSGYLVNSGDTKALSQKMVDILDKDFKRYLIKEFQSSFSVVQFIQKIQNEYKRVLSYEDKA